MRSPVPFLIGLIFIAGLSAGCADSSNGSIGAKEQVVSVSEKLTPEESALVASGEAETESNPHPVSLETR